MIIDEQIYLEHHGIMGMRWGVRQPKSETGVGRMVGGKLDRNARKRASFKKGISGKGFSRYRGLGVQFLTTRKHRKEVLTRKMNKLNAQDKRIMSGKRKVRDNLQIYGATQLTAMAVSVRPDKKATFENLKKSVRSNQNKFVQDNKEGPAAFNRRRAERLVKERSA